MPAMKGDFIAQTWSCTLSYFHTTVWCRARDTVLFWITIVTETGTDLVALSETEGAVKVSEKRTSETILIWCRNYVLRVRY